MVNIIKAFIFLGGLTVLAAWIGHRVAGTAGLVFGMALGVMGVTAVYMMGNQRVLGFFAAEEVDVNSSPTLYQIVSEVAQQMNIPVPRIYQIIESQPNLFAIGFRPSGASIVVTTGLLKLLDGRELRAVIAHECAHIRQRDTLISVVVAVVMGVVTDLAERMHNQSYNMKSGKDAGQKKALFEHRRIGGVAYMFTTFLQFIAAFLVQMIITRSRDYMADRSAAELTQDPVALANALQKIQHAVRQVSFSLAERYPATAQMMFVDPLRADSIKSFFSPHPRTEKRVKRLLATQAE